MSDSIHGWMRELVREQFGTQIEWAKILGVSPAFASQVLSGRGSPTDAMLASVGLERVTVYRGLGQQIEERRNGRR